MGCATAPSSGVRVGIDSLSIGVDDGGTEGYICERQGGCRVVRARNVAEKFSEGNPEDVVQCPVPIVRQTLRVHWLLLNSRIV
jgi:hypothetical protein